MLNDRTFKCLKILKGNGEYSRVGTRSKHCDNFWLVPSSVERIDVVLISRQRETRFYQNDKYSHCTLLKIIVSFQKKFKWILLSLCRYYKNFASASSTKWSNFVEKSGIISLRNEDAKMLSMKMRTGNFPRKEYKYHLHAIRE